MLALFSRLEARQKTKLHPLKMVELAHSHGGHRRLRCLGCFGWAQNAPALPNKKGDGHFVAIPGTDRAQAHALSLSLSIGFRSSAVPLATEKPKTGKRSLGPLFFLLELSPLFVCVRAVLQDGPGGGHSAATQGPVPKPTVTTQHPRCVSVCVWVRWQGGFSIPW